MQKCFNEMWASKTKQAHCGSGEDRESKREEERREVKEEENRRTSIITFLCVRVGIVFVLCINWNNLMLCVILCIIVCALFRCI